MLFSKMSCHKPFALKICTKRTEIQDISISNSLIKVLNLSGLTSAIVKKDGNLDQKFILFFENVFGEAPITFTRFTGFTGKLESIQSAESLSQSQSLSQSLGLVLGFADGSLIVFDKCPSKSLLETNYKRIPSTLTHSAIEKVLFKEDEPILTVHKIGNCYEFVNLKTQEILIIPEVKQYNCFLDCEEEIKVAFITNNGNFKIKTVKSQVSDSLLCCSLNPTALCQIKKVSNWLILSNLNRILIFDIKKLEIISSFTLTEASEIKRIEIISSNSEFIELFAITRTEILRLKIDPIRNSLEIEKYFYEIFGLFVNEFFYILVKIDGIFVHDTLTNRLINKFSYPKYFLKAGADNDCHDVTISSLAGNNKFLFLWGKSLAQIWDFNPRNSSSKQTTKKQEDSDKGIQGNKALRKYTKYAVNHGIEEYKDEKMEEDHLNHLRDHLNIEGLNEEELIAYAKLISMNNNENIPIDDTIENVSDDPELEMALKLSLIEM